MADFGGLLGQAWSPNEQIHPITRGGGPPRRAATSQPGGERPTGAGICREQHNQASCQPRALTPKPTVNKEDQATWAPVMPDQAGGHQQHPPPPPSASMCALLAHLSRGGGGLPGPPTALGARFWSNASTEVSVSPVVRSVCTICVVLCAPPLPFCLDALPRSRVPPHTPTGHDQ